MLRFCTKRDMNGNRKYLIINTDDKKFTLSYDRIFSESDFIEIKSKDRDKLCQQLKAAGYGQYIKIGG